MQFKHRIAGANVLELGTGRGLCGLLAVELGARQMVFTDCSWTCLKVLLPNIPGHADGPRCSSGWGEGDDPCLIRRHLWESDLPRSPGRGAPQHWSNWPQCTWGPQGAPPELEADMTVEVVIGADLLYFPSQVDPLLATLSLRLALGGLALLTVTVRTRAVYMGFLEKLGQFGLVIESEGVVDVDALDEHHLETRSPAEESVHDSRNAQEVRLVLLARV